MMELLHEAEFWVLIGFILFVVLIWRKASLALTGGLDARGERIRKQIDEAAALRAEAETMLHDAEQRQRAALEEAKAILADATREAARLKEQAAKDLASLLERRRQGALDKIAQAEATAIAEVRRYAVDVAIAATREVLTAQVQGSLADRMIDQAIAELPRRLS
jgi:F-type H+-transporting ATPase subunit b